MSFGIYLLFFSYLGYFAYSMSCCAFLRSLANFRSSMCWMCFAYLRFFYLLKALCVLEWLSLFLVLRYSIQVQYAIVIEKLVSEELDFLEFSYISRHYKFSSPLLDRINSTSLWPAQSTFFAFILHSGNLKRISAGDFGACNYTDFVAEAVGGCEKKFYSNLATDLTADCRYV